MCCRKALVLRANLRGACESALGLLFSVCPRASFRGCGLSPAQVLKINEKDTVLTLTSGGCNGLNLLLHGAGQVNLPFPSFVPSGLSPTVLQTPHVALLPACLPENFQHILLVARQGEWGTGFPALAGTDVDEGPELVRGWWQVVSVDCNPAQSALLELKVAAIRYIILEYLRRHLLCGLDNMGDCWVKALTYSCVCLSCLPGAIPIMRVQTLTQAEGSWFTCSSCFMGFFFSLSRLPSIMRCSYPWGWNDSWQSMFHGLEGV